MKFLFLSLLFTFLGLPVAGQVLFSGQVVNRATREALEGVKVEVLNPDTLNSKALSDSTFESFTLTDENGSFKLLLAGEKQLLTFSAPGYIPKTINTGSRTRIKLSLDSLVLQEHVYVHTAMGIQQDPSLLTNHIQEVNDSLLNIANEPNLLNTLQGKFSGVLITRASGSPGAGSTIRIRGSRSILGNNDPLMILDGIPIDNSIHGASVSGVDLSNRMIDIDPENIESVSILKSPFANVLYGIRGANGAVIITTKKGKSTRGRLNVDLNYSITAEKVNRLPELQKLYAQGRPIGGIPSHRGPETAEGFSWGPLFSDLEFATDPNGALAPLPSAFSSEGDYLYDRNGYLVPRGQGNGKRANAYDNENAFFVRGKTHDFDIRIHGEIPKMSYSFSSGGLWQKGIVPTTSFNRNYINAMLSLIPLKSFAVDISAYYCRSGSGFRAQRGSNISGIPIGLYRTTPTFDNGNGLKGLEAANEPTTYQLNDTTQRSYRSGNFSIYDNPFWSINKNPFSDKVDRIISNVGILWEPIENLKITYRAGLDYWKDIRKSGYDIGSANNRLGAVSFDTLSNRLFNSELFIQYEKKYLNGLFWKGIGGLNYFSADFDRKTTSGYDFFQPGLFEMSNVNETAYNAENRHEKINGIYLMAETGYRDFLNLSIAIRNDWSSNLPETANDHLFYGLGMIVDPSKWIGFEDIAGIRFRGNYGVTGNQSIPYLTDTYYDTAFVSGDGWINGIEFPNYGVLAYQASETAPNEKLKPELTSGYEIGMDIEVLDSRLGLAYTYYNQQSENLIINTEISAVTGYASLFTNSGKVSNLGHELNVLIVPIRKNLTWEMGFNFTAFKNEIIELNPGMDDNGIRLSGFTSTSSRAITDQPYGVLFGGNYERINNQYWPDEGMLEIGTDGWPLTNPYSGPIGDPNPDWYMGIQNHLNWRGITFYTLFDFRVGHDIWNGTHGVNSYWGVSKETAEQRDISGYVFDGMVNTNTWDNPVYEQNTTPVDFANPENGLGGNKWVRYGFGFSENEIEKGSWFRIRELALSYDFPYRWVERIKARKLALSLIGRNVLLITDYRGSDPETNLDLSGNGFGLDYYNLPHSRSWGVKIDMSFK